MCRGTAEESTTPAQLQQPPHRAGAGEDTMTARAAAQAVSQRTGHAAPCRLLGLLGLTFHVLLARLNVTRGQEYTLNSELHSL